MPIASSLPVPSSPGSIDPPWSRRGTALAIASIMLIWAVAAAIWPLTSTVVPWDSKNHFYPMLRYMAGTFQLDEWPLWNPFHFSGHPTVADPQSLLFTPVMLFVAWLAHAPSMQLFDVAVFSHFLIGSLGIVGLFRRRHWHPAGAVLAAAVFILGGSAAARLQHSGMIFSYGLMPMALFLLETSLARCSWRIGIFFAIAAATMALGRDQIAFFSCVILVAALAKEVALSGQPLAYLKARWLALATMAVVGAAIVAVPVLLTLQFLEGSNRPEIGYGTAIMGSLPAPSFATLFFPNIFGTLNLSGEYWGPGPLTMPDGSWTDRSINYVFIGTVPALLLVWHGIAARRLAQRGMLFFAAIGIVAVLFALGRYTPAFLVMFDHVPGVKLYRRPADATFIINFIAAMAGGYLLHRYCRDGLPKAHWRGFGTGAAVSAAVLLMGFALYWSFDFAARAGKIAFAAKEVSMGLGIAAIAVAALVFGRRDARTRAVVACGLAAFTAGQLIWRHAASAINAEPVQRYAVFEQLPPEQLQGLKVLKKELDARNAKGEHPRVEILGLGGAWQNASMVFGIEDTVGYNALRISDYQRAVGSGENAVDLSLRKFPGTFRGYRCRLASLLGLEYLVLDRPMDLLPRHFPRLTGAEVLYGRGQMWIYKLSPTAPRAYLATTLHAVDSEAALEEEELPEFDRNGEALIDESSTALLKGDFGQTSSVSPAGAKADVRIARYRRNEVTLNVHTDTRGVVVLHDIYYPGWRVYVDGERRPMLKVNLIFRGVEVGKGRHNVTFRFQPLAVDNLVAAVEGLIEPKQEESEVTVR